MQAIKEKFPTSPEGKPLRNKPSAYQVYKYTWLNYLELSMHFARALVALGVEERSVVLIQGANTPEHMVCIMGTILANCVFSDIYPTNMPDVCLYQVKHSQAKVICCDTYARLKTKFLVNQEQLVAAGVKACILFDEGKTVDEIITVPGKCPIRIITWAQLITKTCSEIGTGVILKRIDNQKPGECCDLVYTSGTTGEPKAVMLSHDNLTWTWSVYNNIKYLSDPEAADPLSLDPTKVVSFLPLSHIMAQMADLTRPIVSLRPICVTFAP